MVRALYMMVVMLLIAGCGPRYVDYFPYYDDGTPKPRVAVLPVTDATNDCVPWDIAREISDGVRHQAMCDGKLFLLADMEVSARLQGSTPAYFGTDLSYVNAFAGSDYVVAIELIEHDLVSYDEGDCAAVIPKQRYSWNAALQMKLRLRVIDVRNKPKILLQEIFTSDYAIPEGKECLDYSKCGWGSKTFLETPYGYAHHRMIVDLVNRVEMIICGH